MATELLLTYLVTITVLTITPGLDTMLMIRNSARGGWRDGTVTSVGICSGLFIHASISAIGISVILMQTAWAFNVLKILGAGYLIWLGLINLRSMFGQNQGIVVNDDSVSYSFKPLRSLREGFLSNVLNPKTAIFYMAFLPQFIDPTGSAFAQSMMLAGIHFAIAMIWQCSLALMVNRARVFLAKPNISRAFNGLTGSLMMMLGLRLALEK